MLFLSLGAIHESSGLRYRWSGFGQACSGTQSCRNFFRESDKGLLVYSPGCLSLLRV